MKCMHVMASPPNGCLRERNGSSATIAAGDPIQLRCEPWLEVVEVEQVLWMQCDCKIGRKTSCSSAVVE